MATIKVYDYTKGDEPTVYDFEMGDELEKMLDAARTEWAILKEKGTPYWCDCEPAIDMIAAMETGDAYWQNDMWDEPEYDGIHGKHGVMHRGCGGYLQEG